MDGEVGNINELAQLRTLSTCTQELWRREAARGVGGAKGATWLRDLWVGPECHCHYNGP